MFELVFCVVTLTLSFVHHSTLEANTSYIFACFGFCYQGSVFSLSHPCSKYFGESANLKLLVIYISQAMGLMLMPQSAPDAVRNVAYMVDEIWYHAGDTSTDVSYFNRFDFKCLSPNITP